MYNISNMPKVLTTSKITNQITEFFLADFHKAIPFHIKLQIKIKIKIGKEIPKIDDMFVMLNGIFKSGIKAF